MCAAKNNNYRFFWNLMLIILVKVQKQVSLNVGRGSLEDIYLWSHVPILYKMQTLISIDKYQLEIINLVSILEL